MTDQNECSSLSSGPRVRAGARPDTAWQVQDAKARFSELLDASLTEGPQIITRRGAEIAAVVPIEQWRRLESAAPSLKDLLLEPVRGSDPLMRPRGRFHRRPVRPTERTVSTESAVLTGSTEPPQRSEQAVYLIESDVIAALHHPTPDQAVLSWITDVPPNRLHISAVAVGEIQADIEETRAKDPLKAQELEEWLLRLRCAYNVLAADAATFREWARLVHDRLEAPAGNAIIAATAVVHRLTVVTGNVEHFEPFGVPTLNPFKPKS